MEAGRCEQSLPNCVGGHGGEDFLVFCFGAGAVFAQLLLYGEGSLKLKKKKKKMKHIRVLYNLSQKKVEGTRRIELTFSQSETSNH